MYDSYAKSQFERENRNNNSRITKNKEENTQLENNIEEKNKNMNIRINELKMIEKELKKEEKELQNIKNKNQSNIKLSQDKIVHLNKMLKEEESDLRKIEETIIKVLLKIKNLNNKIINESFNSGEKTFNDILEEIEKSGVIEDKMIWNNIKKRFNEESEKYFEDSTEND